MATKRVPEVIACQRCKQVLKLDNSLLDLNPAAVDLLVGPLISDKSNDKQQPPFMDASMRAAIEKGQQEASRRTVGPLLEPLSGLAAKEGPNVGADSFIVLSKSQITPPSNDAQKDASADSIQRSGSISHPLKVANKLFDIMSAKSEIDHPLCQECTDALSSIMNKQLEEAAQERDCYIDFLKQVNANMVSDEDQERLRKEIAEIKAAEAAAIKSLEETEKMSEALKIELAELEKESKELDEMEEKYWQDYNSFNLQLSNFHNERDSVNMKFDHDCKQLEKLQKTNVYNDTFNIGHDGHFGTINSFRLGRLPSQPVDWSEINAAWGQTLLLLYTVANKLKFTFETYRLIPLGSFSKIEKIDGDRAVYELYGSGDFAFGRMFMNRRFEMAMVAFLNCLQQLGDYAESQDPNLKLPYRINKDKIGDASIKLQFNQDEVWTRALKYTLTNAKWILAFASSNTAPAS